MQNIWKTNVKLVALEFVTQNDLELIDVSVVTHRIFPNYDGINPPMV
jgi:hypothetical protein